MVNIEINGIPVQAADGSMLIEAADQAGIAIPRFCYHKKLSIAANCRMCLVEVEKMGKPMPACATPVNEGMKVFTKSPKAISAQRAVMEFLLINHPLDCPICDQGGECDLQEMALGYGNGTSQYGEAKRVVADQPIGPLIATEMTRCIHCTRCVRFGQEIAGVMELGATGRGEHMRIGTYVAKSVSSELSGNVIDLCPVGALTSRPYRYSARPWELDSHDSVSPHDCLGANIQVQSRRGELQRVLPRDNEALNECWLSDRDRFAYLGLAASDRLSAPRIKRDGEWQTVDWDTALTFAAEGIKAAGNSVGALAGYSSTTEEYYLLQKLVRGLGSNNIDFRLRQLDFSDQARLPAMPGLSLPVVEIESIDAALLIGANVRKEQPLLGLRLRKAALNGAAIHSVAAVDYAANLPMGQRIVTAPEAMVASLVAVAKALLVEGGSAPEGFAALAEKVEVSIEAEMIAASLKGAEKGIVWVGAMAAGSPDAAALRSLAALIADLSGCQLQLPGEGGNSAGAALAGCLPHRAAAGSEVDAAGLDWRAMLGAGLKALVLMNCEPELDCADSRTARTGLEQAGFVVALSGYASQAMVERCDVLLPMAMSYETSGTLVNAQGNWQGFGAAIAAPGDARPAWKLLRVLGNLLDLDGFEQFSSEEIRDELKALTGATGTIANQLRWQPVAPSVRVEGLSGIAEFAIHGVDPVVRRAAALQASIDGQGASVVRVHSTTAAARGFNDGQKVMLRTGEWSCAPMPLVVDDTVPAGCVLLRKGTEATQGCSSGFGPVELIPA